MSKIDDLIQEMCPEGVRFTKLGTECKVLRGKRLTKKVLSPLFQYPVFHGGLIPLGNYSQYNRKANQTMIINTGSVGEVVWSPQEFWSSDGTFTIETPEYIDDKFLYYFLKGQEVYLKSQRREGGVPTIDRETVERIDIPIPPLPIQQEIVSILDNFTKLEAELEAELEARKKQYDYYRNQLLTPKEIDGKWFLNGIEVEWTTLGNVCLHTENINWKATKGTEFQYIDLSSVSRECNRITETKTVNHKNAPSRAQQVVRIDDVIFGTTRPTLQRYALVTEEHHNQVCSTGFCVLRPDINKLLAKYLFFTLTTSVFKEYVDKNQEGASYPSISNRAVKMFTIPIPPIDEQERIVSILDRFDALVNDITIGLPGEIAARRKQYEYFRGKLLTFKNIAEGQEA